MSSSAEAQRVEIEPEAPPDVPFLFGCALWVPVFCVLLYFFLKFLGPKVTVGPPESGPGDS